METDSSPKEESKNQFKVEKAQINSKNILLTNFQFRNYKFLILNFAPLFKYHVV